ncbi:MAG: hypothetical protein ABH823_02505 [bacterium]
MSMKVLFPFSRGATAIGQMARSVREERLGEFAAGLQTVAEANLPVRPGVTVVLEGGRGPEVLDGALAEGVAYLSGATGRAFNDSKNPLVLSAHLEGVVGDKENGWEVDTVEASHIGVTPRLVERRTDFRWRDWQGFMHQTAMLARCGDSFLQAIMVQELRNREIHLLPNSLMTGQWVRDHLREPHFSLTVGPDTVRSWLLDNPWRPLNLNREEDAEYGAAITWDILDSLLTNGVPISADPREQLKQTVTMMLKSLGFRYSEELGLAGLTGQPLPVRRAFLTLQAMLLPLDGAVRECSFSTRDPDTGEQSVADVVQLSGREIYPERLRRWPERIEGAMKEPSRLRVANAGLDWYVEAVHPQDDMDPGALLRATMELRAAGIISDQEALARLPDSVIDQLKTQTVGSEAKRDLIGWSEIYLAEACQGVVVRTLAEARRLAAEQTPFIFMPDYLFNPAEIEHYYDRRLAVAPTPVGSPAEPSEEYLLSFERRAFAGDFAGLLPYMDLVVDLGDYDERLTGWVIDLLGSQGVPFLADVTFMSNIDPADLAGRRLAFVPRTEECLNLYLGPQEIQSVFPEELRKHIAEWQKLRAG